MRYAAFLLVLITLYGCVKDEFCIEPNAVLMTVDFKTYDSTRLVDTPLLDATVYNTENALFFADGLLQLRTVDIALDRTAVQQTYIIYHSMTQDTIQVSYTTEEVFISNGCGYQTYFELQNVSHSKQNIDSVNIIKSQVDNTAQNPHLEVIYK